MWGLFGGKLWQNSAEELCKLQRFKNHVINGSFVFEVKNSS